MKTNRLIPSTRGLFESVVEVETRPAALDVASVATFPASARVVAILRPKSTNEVQACLRLAGAAGISIYPISTGKNWGYGSRVPPYGECALLDLSRMNRILEYNEENAYVTVEPGVTQAQLFEFLADRGSKLMIDCTGASPEASVVANTIERGFGHSPYADHFSQACNFEVVLPTGEVIETGHGRFGAASAPTYRWGVGPVLDGLFSQSNLGVVTRCTLWLMPRPEAFEVFFFRCDRPDQLAGAVDALRPLRLDGSLRSAVHIGNGYKVLSGIQQFPWDLTEGRTPLQPSQLETLARQYSFGAWNASGALYGSHRQVSEQRRLVKQALSGKVTRVAFVSQKRLDLAVKVAGIVRAAGGWDLSRVIELARPLFSLLQGQPSAAPLRSVYWRKRNPPPEHMDPDRDGCGLIWCAPVAPLRGEHAAALAGIAERTLLGHGFEPMISITLLTERTLACIVSIQYDRSVPGEDEQAMACHSELVSAIRSAGFHFYRLGVQSMEQAASAGEYWNLLARVKNLFDPAGILAPGRYMPLE